MTPEAGRPSAAHLRLPDLPTGWEVVTASGPGPFTTRATLARPDGATVEWTSRRHRKGLGLRRLRRPGAGRRTGPDEQASGPSTSSLLMGGLFAVGSLLFALGSVPRYFDHVDPSVVAATFFAGSLFFTTAALVQFQESRNTPAAMVEPAVAVAPSRHRRLPVVAPGRIDWWASTIQLVGTVLFNVSTFAATRQDLSTEQARRLVWSPDVFGSVCFLVASWLAYSEVNVGVRPRPDRSTGWRIAALNMAGSLAFGVSAVAARYLRSTGEVANLALVNASTLVGALCFGVGAILLPVESARDRVPGLRAEDPSG